MKRQVYSESHGVLTQFPTPGSAGIQELALKFLRLGRSTAVVIEGTYLLSLTLSTAHDLCCSDETLIGKYCDALLSGLS